MLQVRDVSYSIGERQILNSVTFSLMPEDKVALVGVNGAGKSTLVKIIMGELSPNEGSVEKPQRMGYVPQTITDEVIVQEEGTIEEFMMEGRGLNDIIYRRNKSLKSMSSKELSEKEMKSILEKYSNIEEEFEAQGGYEAESEIETILNGIGLPIELNRIVSTLSGGEKTRLSFARSLFANSDLLILDEPTNHIDRQYYSWLGNYLKQIKKTILVVSHHPDFINPFTRRIFEIEKFTGRMREYHGTYDDYLAQSAQNEESLMREVDWLDKEISRLLKSARRLQHGGPNKANAAQNMFGRVERLKIQRNNIINEIPREERKLSFKLPVSQRSGQLVVKAVNLSKSFDRQIFTDVNFKVYRGERVAILGPNGSGKTTIIRGLMSLLNFDDGKITLGFNVLPGYYAQEHENLNPKNSVLEEAQASCSQGRVNVRGILGRFLFSQDKVFQKVDTLSQGEKSRLSLCKLILGDFNLIILDEPTNYLDPISRNAVCDALQDYEGTIIFVSHDRSFIKKMRPDKAIIMPNGNVSVFVEELLENQ